LILRKTSKIGATSCQTLRQKCTKFDFRRGYAYSTLSVCLGPPDHPALFNGAYF